MNYLDAADQAGIFDPHAFHEQTVDLGEIRMNYAVAGDASNPALLLIQGMGPVLRLWQKGLGPQWPIGDFTGMQAAMVRKIPEWMRAARRRMDPVGPDETPAGIPTMPHSMHGHDPATTS